jgi:hypothetical protein
MAVRGQAETVRVGRADHSRAVPAGVPIMGMLGLSRCSVDSATRGRMPGQPDPYRPGDLLPQEPLGESFAPPSAGPRERCPGLIVTKDAPDPLGDPHPAQKPVDPPHGSGPGETPDEVRTAVGPPGQPGSGMGGRRGISGRTDTPAGCALTRGSWRNLRLLSGGAVRHVAGTEQRWAGHKKRQPCGSSASQLRHLLWMRASLIRRGPSWSRQALTVTIRFPATNSAAPRKPGMERSCAASAGPRVLRCPAVRPPTGFRSW